MHMQPKENPKQMSPVSKGFIDNTITCRKKTNTFQTPSVLPLHRGSGILGVLIDLDRQIPVSSVGLWFARLQKGADYDCVKYCTCLFGAQSTLTFFCSEPILLVKTFGLLFGTLIGGL